MCDINGFPQITVGPGTVQTGPLLPNSPVTYTCDVADFFVRGPPETNMCDSNGEYASTTAPTCERGMRLFSYGKYISILENVLVF